MAVRCLVLAGILAVVAGAQSSAAPPPAEAPKVLDLDALAGTPKSASTVPQERADMGTLTRKLGRLWKLNCDIPGVVDARIEVAFKIGHGGYVIQGPEWRNPRSDPVHPALYDSARVAVIEGQPYSGLPDAIYGRDLIVTFDAVTVCEKNRKGKP